MSPLFSIIVPIYNVKEFIGTAIESVLAQSFRDFELLAIDDGSTDGSEELIDKIAQRDHRVRVIHQQNAGVSAARNRGLDEARGEWIVFVDGDDALRYDALQILSECISRNPHADLIGYNYKKVDSISHDTIYNNRVLSNNASETVSYKERVYDCRHTTCFSALNHYMVWSEAYRRDMLGNLRFEALKNGEDVLFCNGAALKSDYYVAIEAPIYFYLQRDVSARSNEWTLSRLEDYSKLHYGIFDNLTNNTKSINPMWIKRWIGMLLLYLPGDPQVDISTRKIFFNQHLSLLRKVRKLPNITLSLKIWIRIATLLNSEAYFKLTATGPMKLYSKLNK